MTIERRECESGAPRVVATECPYCDQSLRNGQGLAHHLPCAASQAARSDEE